MRLRAAAPEDCHRAREIATDDPRRRAIGTEDVLVSEVGVRMDVHLDVALGSGLGADRNRRLAGIDVDPVTERQTWPSQPADSVL